MLAVEVLLGAVERVQLVLTVRVDLGTERVPVLLRELRLGAAADGRKVGARLTGTTHPATRRLRLGLSELVALAALDPLLDLGEEPLHRLGVVAPALLAHHLLEVGLKDLGEVTAAGRGPAATGGSTPTTPRSAAAPAHAAEVGTHRSLAGAIPTEIGVQPVVAQTLRAVKTGSVGTVAGLRGAFDFAVRAGRRRERLVGRAALAVLVVLVRGLVGGRAGVDRLPLLFLPRTPLRRRVRRVAVLVARVAVLGEQTFERLVVGRLCRLATAGAVGGGGSRRT